MPGVDIAAALAKLARGDEPLLLEKPDREARAQAERPAFDSPRQDWDERPARAPREPGFKKERVAREAEPGMASYRIEVGYVHGAKPGNIVGAIANEAGIPSKLIGRIEIYDDYSTLDLPDDMTPELVQHLKGVWVAGRQLDITRDGEEAPAAPKKSFAKKGGDRRVAEKAEKAGGKKPHRKGGAPKGE